MQRRPHKPQGGNPSSHTSPQPTTTEKVLISLSDLLDTPVNAPSVSTHNRLEKNVHEWQPRVGWKRAQFCKWAGWYLGWLTVTCALVVNEVLGMDGKLLPGWDQELDTLCLPAPWSEVIGWCGLGIPIFLFWAWNILRQGDTIAYRLTPKFLTIRRGRPARQEILPLRHITRWQIRHPWPVRLLGLGELRIWVRGSSRDRAAVVELEGLTDPEEISDILMRFVGRRPKSSIAKRPLHKKPETKRRLACSV